MVGIVASEGLPKKKGRDVPSKSPLPFDSPSSVRAPVSVFRELNRLRSLTACAQAKLEALLNRIQAVELTMARTRLELEAASLDSDASKMSRQLVVCLSCVVNVLKGCRVPDSRTVEAVNEDVDEEVDASSEMKVRGEKYQARIETLVS